MNNFRTLVVAAHPDDEVLGCGGTIARLADNGCQVFIAIMGEGITSRYEQRHLAPITEIQALHRQSREAAKLLGAKEVIFFDLPDNRLDALPLLEIIKPLEKMIEDLKPDTIYTHHGGDLNIDHSVVFRAVLTATRPQPARASRLYSLSKSLLQPIGPSESFHLFFNLTPSSQSIGTWIKKFRLCRFMIRKPELFLIHARLKLSKPLPFVGAVSQV